MSGNYKVRFHLGQGKYHRHWQVITPDGGRKFYDPEEYSFVLTNARLHNNCKVATKIYNGQNKTVCAWITCEELETVGIMSYLFSKSPMEDATKTSELFYNPRKNPHWMENGKNVDFKNYKMIFTKGDSVFTGYIPKED